MIRGMKNIVKLNPTVCAVGRTYQIMIVSEKDALISVRVGDKAYYNHSNGIRISTAGVHRITVPADVLDRERSYTVVVQSMIERRAYFPEVGDAVEKTYQFRPIEKTNDINIYHLADVHGEFQQAVDAAKYLGKNLDLLIMNGDISSTSDTFDDIILCYKIASEVTKGEIPCIISRGNHDLRGSEAENLAKYMPGDAGRSYYTFKTGCIWGILVDTGEDKDDSYPAYGGTICCHDFRLEQEEMIKNTIKNADDEYAQDGVEYKIILSHVPFTFKKKQEKFDIERELYSNWSRLIKDNVKPDFMLCGHTHKACVSRCGSEYDDLGQPCTIIVGSDLTKTEDEKYIFAGALINIKDSVAKVVVNTSNEILFEETVALQNKPYLNR